MIPSPKTIERVTEIQRNVSILMASVVWRTPGFSGPAYRRSATGGVAAVFVRGQGEKNANGSMPLTGYGNA